jgi:transcriptional antiterminator RfaH
MASWVVVRTKSAAEGIAGANLIRQGFVPYVPRISETVLSRVAGKFQKLLITKPLFPGLIFVRIEQRWRSIISTYGTNGIVMVGEQPAIVRDQVIADLKRREDRDGMVKLPRPTSRLKPNQKVSIMSGVFAGKQGIYQGMESSKRSWVLLEFIGGKRSFIINEESLEATTQ